jgi:hypothetical protein
MRAAKVASGVVFARCMVGTASSCAMAMAVAGQITWGVVVFTSYRDGRMSVISSDRVGDRRSYD